MTREEAVEVIKKNKPTSDPRKCGKELCEACDAAIEALENCPPKDSLCYGCHDNCKKCEIMGLAMV